MPKKHSNLDITLRLK